MLGRRACGAMPPMTSSRCRSRGSCNPPTTLAIPDRLVRSATVLDLGNVPPYGRSNRPSDGSSYINATELVADRGAAVVLLSELPFFVVKSEVRH
jgi:hypothetical protein